MSLQILRLVESERPRCLACGSRDVGMAGKHLRVSKGELVQNYRCKRCGTSFLADVYPWGKRPREDVDLAVSLAKKRLTYADIARKLYADSRPISSQTIKKWIEKFAPALKHEYADPKPDPKVLEALKRKVDTRRLPAIRFADLGSSRRVLLDASFRSKAQRELSSYSPVYHSLYSYSRHAHHTPTWAPSVKRARQAAKLLGLSESQLEKHVLRIYSGRSGQSKILSSGLPLRANGSFAFLMGLFYASGGIGGGTLHFAVDRQVGEYLRYELSNELHEIPEFVSQGRKPHGSMSLTYGLTMLSVLRKFGLKVAGPVQLGKGKWVPSRSITLGIPRWIRREPSLMHRFVEGYINGLKTSCELKGIIDRSPRNVTEGKLRRVPHPTTVGKISANFCSYNRRELLAFIRPFVAHLQSLGVTGWLRRARTDHRKMLHYQYSFHTLPQMKNFQENFLMLRPTIRLKLLLRLTEDPVIKKVTQRIRGLDGFVLGSLLEGPKTSEQLARACPRRPYNMTQTQLLQPSLDRLSRMGVISIIGKKWRYQPRRFALALARGYMADFEARSAKIRKLNTSPKLYLCRACGTVGERARCDLCGRQREPCGRNQLRRLNNPRARLMARELIKSVSNASGRRERTMLPVLEVRNR